MVFWLRPQRTWIDWTLFWLLFVNFMILPTDVLCPAWLHEYIHKTFWLDVYTYFICWLRIVWWAVGPKEELKAESVKLKILLPLLMLSLPLGTMAQRRPATKVFSVKGVQFKMQFVQGGTFTMGALPHDTLADDDEVRHRVLVNNFYIGETEVTQELWEAVMPKNRSKHRGNGQWPVEYVTYDMCKDFIISVCPPKPNGNMLPVAERSQRAISMQAAIASKKSPTRIWRNAYQCLLLSSSPTN